MQPKRPDPADADYAAYAGCHAWPNVETFAVWHAAEGDDDAREFGYDGPGWYWAFQSPGCLPDADMYGPFQTSHAAYLDACSTILEQLHDVDPF
jgi:hypothetical protein